MEDWEAAFPIECHESEYHLKIGDRLKGISNCPQSQSKPVNDRGKYFGCCADYTSFS